MIKRLLFLLLLIAPATFAQTSVTGRWGVGAFATRPAACGSGDTWTDTDDANSYKCFPNGTWNTITGGGGGTPAGITGDVQINSSGTFGNVSGFNYHSSGNTLFMPFNLAIIGPSPWVDILQYGASPTAIHTTGTGSGTALTVGVSTFANGNGITIAGGGATPTIGIPPTPTITPGESETETVVDALMTAGVSGGSSYSYCILAEDTNGGVTVCSPTATNASGPTALGKTSVTLSAISLTGATLSFTSSAAHGLVQNALAHITSGSNSYFLSGWFTIQTITDATHAGATNTAENTGGSTVTSASGTLVYFIGNNVKWTASSGSVYRYWVCAQRPGDGSLHIIGTALPGTTQFVDFGFNLNQNVPWYMSDANCTAASAQSQLDVDTVASGGGTTSLVLSNGLTTAVTGALTRLDNVTAFRSAYSTSTAKSAVYIPPSGTGVFEFNSPLATGSNLGVLQVGTVAFYAPFWPPQGMNWSGTNYYRGNTQTWVFEPTAPSLIQCFSNPCIDFFHFSAAATTLSSVGLIGPTDGNGVLIANGRGFNSRFADVKMQTGTSNNDNMGIALWAPSGAGQQTPCNNCSFSGGPNQNIDQTWAPLVYLEGDAPFGQSGMVISNSTWSRRGFMAKYTGGSSGALVLNNSYMQGNITPMVAFAGTGGNIEAIASLDQMHMDSSQQAGLALWGIGSNLYLSYHIGLANGPQNDGGGTPALVTGSGDFGTEWVGERIGDFGPNGQFIAGVGFSFNGNTLIASNPLSMSSNLFTASTETVSTSLLNSGFFDVTETAAPANPASGNERWYANSTTHNFSCLTSAGGNCSPSGGAPTLQTNSVNNSTQNLLNLINSTTNATGLVITDTNTSGGIVQAEISGTVNLASGGCAGSSATTCFNNISLMTTLGDLLYGGSGGAETRLQGPGVGTNLTYVLEDIPSGGSATAPQWGILGVPVPATQTGAFTFSASGSAGTLGQADQLNDILANPSGASTYTIPAVSALNFANNPAWTVFNQNASNTITYSSASTIIGDTTTLPLWQTRITQQPGTAYIIRSTPSAGAWGSTCTTKAIQWSTTSGILCNQLPLTTGVTGILPIANGGTNASTQQGALNNIAPSAVRAGDVMYFNGTNWTNLAGNNAGTQFLSENGSGVPSWSSGTTTTPLQSVTAATSSATIANANNPITWNWAQTTASQYGFTLGETSAKTGAGGGSLLVQTQAGSTGIPVTVINSLTGSQTLAALTVTPTWNTTGVVDAGILENVTNTASGAASLLMDLQVGGTSEFKVDKAGNETITGTLNSLTIPASAGSATFAQKIASGTAAMGTGAISSGTCAAAVTVSATGVATTDTIKYNPNTDPTAVTGYAPASTGSLYVWAYPTSNNVNFKVCNNTSASITPSALTFNWEVTR